MIYEALVLNTDSFFKTGKIIVRIPAFYMRNMKWDLTEDYPEFLEQGQTDGEQTDFEAYIYSPYGGGKNFGTFFLPQVNQRGIVANLNKGMNKLIWLGSFFQDFRDSELNLDHINIPSDDPTKPNGVLSDITDEEIEESKTKNFVARFKTTNKSTVEGLNWEEQKTSNIISIGENNMFITHFSKDTGWDEELTPNLFTKFFIGYDEETEKEITYLKRTDTENEKEESIALDDTSFTALINNQKDDKSNKIVLTENSLTALLEADKKIELIIDDVNGIIVKIEDEERLQINTDGEFILKGESFDIESSGNININPDGEIKINGDGSKYVVLYDYLKSIVEKLEKHIHIAPTGPTTSPLENNMTPIQASIAKDKIDMKSDKLRTT